MPMDRPVIEAAFDKMYVGNDSISRAYREGRQARMRLISELTQDMKEANAGAPSPQGFSDDTDRLARLIAARPDDSHRVHGARRLGHARQRRRGATASSRDI